MRCQYLWQLVKIKAKALLDGSETSALSVGFCSEVEILLPDEVMEMLRVYQNSVEKERMFHKKREAAENKFKVVIGTAESETDS